MPNQREIGNRHEKTAADYLSEHGYQIIARNYRAGRCEIDIICTKDNILVFVEVKSAATDEFGDAVFKVNRTKQKAIIAAAQGFVQNANVVYESYRFDVIVITKKGNGLAIEHTEGAFTL